MRIHLIAVGHRRVGWEQDGYREYARRMPPALALTLHEIAPAKRTKGAPAGRSIDDEGRRLLAAVPDGARVVALGERGTPWTTLALARRIESWMHDGRALALLIGGADGLAPACIEAAEHRWSLSPLTLPHGLARIVVAEQLYRASTIHRGHPYHRE
ncbi:MAG: 23S rRNA (pseudouridine(1915)-N(3))-methyltransferase RlmH [Thiotrichales bacterium]|nr:23S rRNA (pseudouridine(1915)-N(3))-methyltransferase RlmH [Thiotrichales bacterium]